VGANAQDAALREPNVQPIEMAGRTMTGFVRIAPESYHTEAALKAWLNRALNFVATLPGKGSFKSISAARSERPTSAMIDPASVPKLLHN
jgi:hypothetical protein